MYFHFLLPLAQKMPLIFLLSLFLFVNIYEKVYNYYNTQVGHSGNTKAQLQANTLYKHFGNLFLQLCVSFKAPFHLLVLFKDSFLCQTLIERNMRSRMKLKLRFLPAAS